MASELLIKHKELFDSMDVDKKPKIIKDLLSSPTTSSSMSNSSRLSPFSPLQTSQMLYEVKEFHPNTIEC